MNKTESIYSHKVYLDETDAQSVVYNANYLVWFERGRSEWLLELSLSHAILEQQHQSCLVLHETKVRFLQPARLGDKIIIKTVLTGSNLMRFQFDQVAISEENSNLIYTTCQSEVISIDSITRKPKRIKINI